jgi:hypothetical protein
VQRREVDSGTIHVGLATQEKHHVDRFLRRTVHALNVTFDILCVLAQLGDICRKGFPDGGSCLSWANSIEAPAAAMKSK